MPSKTLQGMLRRLLFVIALGSVGVWYGFLENASQQYAVTKAGAR